MDLSDALGNELSGGNQGAGSGGVWPGQPPNPTWPGQPASPMWPGGQPANPTWPGGPAQPANPTWPGGPAQSANPTWPGGPAQPSAPGGWPSPAPGPAPSNFPVAPQKSLEVPYSHSFPMGLYPNIEISIAGTIKLNAQKFTINFTNQEDLVFHFNPRFNEDDMKVIVRNSEIGKKWGKEERELRYFPFVPGQPFEMKILVTDKTYKVSVNNSHLLHFKHRPDDFKVTDLRAVNNMTIRHDITLSDVKVETKR